MRKLFALTLAMGLMATPAVAGSLFDNSVNQNTRIRNSNSNTNNVRNRNSNTSINLNKNENSNRNYNTNLNSNRQGQDQYQGQRQGQGQLQGQVGIVKDGDVTIRDGDTKVYASPPSVNAPSLTSGNDVCMGSVSVSASGGSGIIGIGIGFGKTYTDENCVRLKNANALLALGHRDAALALLAINDDVAAALRATSTTFASLKVENAPFFAAEASSPSPSVMNDRGYWGIDFEQID